MGRQEIVPWGEKYVPVVVQQWGGATVSCLVMTGPVFGKLSLPRLLNAKAIFTMNPWQGTIM